MEEANKVKDRVVELLNESMGCGTTEWVEKNCKGFLNDILANSDRLQP